MVLQILSDTWQMMHAGNAVPGKRSRIADARQQQQMRRLEGASGEDYLAPCADDLPPLVLALHLFDADGALALEDDARGLRQRLHAQIGPVADMRMDIAARRAPALAIVLRHLVDAEPLLLGAVEIVADAELRLAGALQKHLPDRIVGAQARDAQRTVLAVIFAVELGIVLRTLK